VSAKQKKETQNVKKKNDVVSTSIIYTLSSTVSICCLSAAAVSAALGKWQQMTGID